MKFVTLLFLLSLASSMCSQQFLQDSMPVKIDNPAGIEVDGLGNVYLYNDLEILKYSVAPVNATFIYSNINYGDIEHIDVSNPFKILVFYKSQNLIDFLDNTLSNEQNKNLNLTDLGLYNVQEFCYSKMANGIWFFDKTNLQLIKVNQQLEIIYQSGNLAELLNLSEDELEVKQLTEYEDKLYVSLPDKILVFDLYGAYYTTIHMPYRGTFTIEENKIFTYSQGKLYVYNLTDFEERKIEINEPDVISGVVRNRKLYLLKKHSILVLKLS